MPGIDWPLALAFGFIVVVCLVILGRRENREPGTRDPWDVVPPVDDPSDTGDSGYRP